MVANFTFYLFLNCLSCKSIENNNYFLKTSLLGIAQSHLEINVFFFMQKHANLLVGWLVGGGLCHINLCRLFNAKSIFM